MYVPISVTMSAVPTDSLHISDVPYNSKELRAMLTPFGTVEFYQKRKSTAIARFKTVEEAISAHNSLSKRLSVVFVESISDTLARRNRPVREPEPSVSTNSNPTPQEGDDDNPISVLYIGGLDISFTSRHLPPLLEEFKLESILLHIEKACAFVYLESAAEATRAIKKLRSNLPGNVGFGNRSKKPVSSPFPFRHIWVDCIDASLPSETIVNEFAAISAVQSFKRGLSRESAIFHFNSPEEAGKASKLMQGKLLGRSKLQIFFVKPITAMG